MVVFHVSTFILLLQKPSSGFRYTIGDYLNKHLICIHIQHVGVDTYIDPKNGLMWTSAPTEKIFLCTNLFKEIAPLLSI